MRLKHRVKASGELVIYLPLAAKKAQRAVAAVFQLHGLLDKAFSFACDGETIQIIGELAPLGPRQRAALAERCESRPDDSQAPVDRPRRDDSPGPANGRERSRRSADR